jgi:hypothetical protein
MAAIIIVLLAIIIFRKPETIILPSDREKTLQDSLILLQRNLDSSHVRQDKLQQSYDSLLRLDPLIITKTRDKVHFILTDASPNELDSVIRTNWKTKSRYR